MPTTKFTTLFLPAFRDHCLTTVRTRIKRLMNTSVPHHKLTKIYKKEWSDRHNFKQFMKLRKKYVQFREVLKDALNASIEMRRNIFCCIDCSLNMWLDGRHAYVIPYGESWIFDEFKAPYGVVDYSYWTTSDQPDDVTRAQWVKRGEVWDRVCLDNWNEFRLEHLIVDIKRRIGLEELSTILPEKFRMAAFFNLEPKK